MNSPADILYVIPRPEIGGAERQLLMLMQGLDRNRFRPHVICLDGGGSLLADYRHAAEQVHILNRRHIVDFNTLRSLIEIIHNIRPALVHTWLYIANLYGGWAARLAGVPSVVVSHRGLGIDPQHSWLKNIQKPIFNFFVSQFSDQLIVNAQAVAAPLFRTGFTPDRTQVIYNGLDLSTSVSETQKQALREEFNIQGNQILLGAIARIDPKKDLGTMLKAVASVARKYNNVRLLIVGGGFPRYQHELEILAKNLGINVDFLGFRNDAQAILSLCDISLLSSITEGLPNAILESMALGKPVVATAVGGVPELIENGVQGFLVPLQTPDRFAQHILTLIENPGLALSMGAAGREKVECNFSIQAMVGNTQNIYHKLTGENSAQRPVSLGLKPQAPYLSKQATERASFGPSYRELAIS